VSEHALIQLLHLRLGLLPCDLLWVVDEQSDYLRVVDVTPPKLARQCMVAAYLLGKLAQDRQANTETLELACWRAILLPIPDTPFVFIGLEEGHHLGLVHDQ